MLEAPCYRLFSFLRYLYFCSDFFFNAEKRIDKKAKVNVEIYGVKDCTTNYYSTHITQDLKK